MGLGVAVSYERVLVLLILYLGVRNDPRTL